MYAESSNKRTSSSINETRCSEPTFLRCANCDIEFPWSPVIVHAKTYCCTGCAAGGPCNCDYSQYRSVNVSGVIHYGIQENTGASPLPDETREQQ